MPLFEENERCLFFFNYLLDQLDFAVLCKFCWCKMKKVTTSDLTVAEQAKKIVLQSKQTVFSLHCVHIAKELKATAGMHLTWAVLILDLTPYLPTEAEAAHASGGSGGSLLHWLQLCVVTRQTCRTPGALRMTGFMFERWLIDDS